MCSQFLTKFKGSEVQRTMTHLSISSGWAPSIAANASVHISEISLSDFLADSDVLPFLDKTPKK